MPARVFISYRRHESAHQAGRLASTLRQVLGQDAVFLDVEGIEAGERWPSALDDALQSASVLILVLGPNWLRLSDEFGLRRIDQSDDWVRRELEVAFSRNIRVVPLCTDGPVNLPADKLPPSIRALADLQRLEIRRDHWDHDAKLLIANVRSLVDGPDTRLDAYDPYPVPPPETPDVLAPEKIRTALEGSLARWSWLTAPLPGGKGGIREELYRELKFRSFADAVGFMARVAPGCDIAIHHPHWENIFRTVYVHLTTFDVGHRITDRDIQLAKYFDKEYGDYLTS